MYRGMAKPTLALSAVVLLVGVGTAVSTPVSRDATRSKPAKCKKGRVPVKVNGKRHCRRLSAALPRPKDVDPRLAYLRAVLNFDVSKRRGRHGKHPRSLQHGFGATGKKARKAFLRALPKALAIIDAAAAAPRSSASAAKAACGPGGAVPVGPPGQTGGLTAQGTEGPHGATGGFFE